MLIEKIMMALGDAPRMLLEAELVPVQSVRFQPTGFPDLGAATYRRAKDGKAMLLVESAQSMANRLETVCWDEANDKIVKPLAGLPHLFVDLGGNLSTSSVQEAHRLNSPHIVQNPDIRTGIKLGIGDPEAGPLDIRRLAKTVLDYDAGSVIHGVFLEKIAGRVRLQRLLSSFIEAQGVEAVTSGGVKFDRIAPSGDTSLGHGNVPFSRTEYNAEKILAYFNLDMAALRGYGLDEAREKLLVAVAFYKIFRVLESGLRLRTACDLEVAGLKFSRPTALQEVLAGGGSGAMANITRIRQMLEKELPDLIRDSNFTTPQPRVVSSHVPAKKSKVKDGDGGGVSV